MANVTKKALNFDLDTKMLKQVYSETSYTNAYYEIRSFLEKNGFEHRQGSGYVSQNPITLPKVHALVVKMNKQLTWLGDCVKEFDVTSVGKSHSLLNKFEKTVEVEKSEPISEEQGNAIDKELDVKDDFDFEMEM